MELALSESLTILRSIVDSINAGIYVLDKNLRIQPINLTGTKVLPAEGSWSGKECYRAILGRSEPCDNCPVLRTFRSGKAERLECSLDWKGKYRHYLLTATPLRSPGETEFSHVVETVQEITAQKQAVEEIARLSEFSNAIIGNAPVAIFTLDANGAFTSVNPALATLSGLGLEAEAKLIGFNWLQNPYTIKSGLARHIKRGLKGEAFQLEDFLFNTYRGDRPHYICFKGVPLRGKDGQVEGLLCIIEESTHRVNERRLLEEKNVALQGLLKRVDAHDALIGDSPSIKEVQGLISVVARSNQPVLILGETGTGKELIARAIHAYSRRSGNPFVAVYPDTLIEASIESELFGKKKGASSGAGMDNLGLLKIADSGTFFMDEVGELDAPLQEKMLKVLEIGAFRPVGDSRETAVDVRFIFATNKNLEDEVREKSFSKDLFDKFKGSVITVPPLRERKEDIPLLVDYFLLKLARGGRKKRITRAAIEMLMDYSWPGNVRELANALERIILILGNRDEIKTGDLTKSMGEAAAEDDRTAAEGPLQERLTSLSDVEREHVQSVLRSVGGNKSKAARLLGISRKTLYRNMGETEDADSRRDSGTQSN